jgi:hypothetical protein
VRIRILDQAKLDLKDGFEFYEGREENLGHYFLDTLYSDIDSLAIYGGIHHASGVSLDAFEAVSLRLTLLD